MQRRISTSSRFFSLFALGRKVVADSPPLAYAQNRKWTGLERTRHFLRSLCSTTALFVRRSQDENRVLDLVFAWKRTEWQLNSRSWAVLWMIDVFKNYKKKGTTVFEGGGGGVMGGGRVRVCQVIAPRITRKVSKFWISFSETCRSIRSPYSTVCLHMEPSAKLGPPNWTLGRKLSRQLTTAGYDLVAKNIFGRKWRPGDRIFPALKVYSTNPPYYYYYCYYYYYYYYFFFFFFFFFFFYLKQLFWQSTIVKPATNKRRVEEGKEECIQKRNESRRKKRRREQKKKERWEHKEKGEQWEMNGKMNGGSMKSVGVRCNEV